MPLYTRVNPGGWSPGNLITAAQINGIDSGIEDVGDYVDGLAEDVTQYGAVGDDATDDSAAIQDALDAAAISKVPVYFPPGIYRANNLSLSEDVSLIGIAYHSKLRGNHASNPLIFSDTDHGGSGSAYPSRVIRGIRFDFSTSNSGGQLARIAGMNRTHFRDCFFDDALSSASAVGLVSVGSSSDVTHVSFDNCGWSIDGDAGQQAIGRLNGTTYVTLNNCRFTFTGSAMGTGVRLRASHFRVSNCLFNLANATASSTLNLFGVLPTPGGSIIACGNQFTALGSGSLVVYDLASGDGLNESGNSYPADITIADNAASLTDLSSFGSRADQYRSYTQTGGGTLTIDPTRYSAFHVNVTDTTAFTLQAASGKLGMTFDLLIRGSSGSPTGTITYSNFGVFGTAASSTIPPPAVVLNGYFMTSRFVWSNGPDGAAWYPVGSSLHAT